METSTLQQESIEILSSVSGIAIDPEDHYELWWVPRRGGQEAPLQRWPDGDATPEEDPDRLRRDPQNNLRPNGLYRLYLFPKGKEKDKALRLEFWLENGIMTTPQADQTQALSPRLDVAHGLPAPPRPAGLPAAAAAPAVGSEPEAEPAEQRLSVPPASATESADTGLSAAEQSLAAAAAVLGTGLLVDPTQRLWERRVDQTLGRFAHRSWNKLARLSRRPRPA